MILSRLLKEPSRAFSTSTFGVALLLLAPLPGTPAVAAKELPPAGGEPREYRLPSADTQALDNGLRLTLIPFGKIPKATISITVQAGNLHEGEDIWLADLSGEMLLQGAGDLDNDGLAAAAANMGAEIGVGVGIDRTHVSIDVLSEFSAAAVALLAKVVRQPTLPTDELARVRGDMLKNLAIRRTQPQAQAEQAFRKRLFGEHPYAVGLPTPADFRALDIDDVRRFHGQNFSAARTHIYVAGLFDHDAVVTAVNEHFADWAAGEAARSDPPTDIGQPGVTLIDRPDAPQSTVYLGVPVVDPTHPQFVELSLMNSLLGGSFSSRITSNIREDKGYTYSPRSSVTARVGSAYWVQTADITTEATGAALKEIFSTLR